jgi:hypothetical protein
MKHATRVAFLVSMGASVGATTIFRLKQHNAAAAGTTKNLEVANPYYVKAAPATKFTRVDPAGVAATAFDLSTTFAAAAGLVVFEVLPEDLDVNNGFTHVSLDIDDAAAAKLGTVIAVTSGDTFGPAYQNDL